MSNTKIKSSQFHGVVGHGTDGYFLMTNADGSMSWAEGGASGPSVTSVAYPGDDLAADPAGAQTVVLTGTNFGSSMTVSIGGTTAPSVAHDSSTQLTITTPAKTAGDYDIVVTNTVTGASGTFVNGISYNGVPTWTTAAGSLGTFESETTISTITLQATEPDGGTITFNITNGALPTGLSLTGANIDGTTTAESSTTLYSFTIEAIDDENQATPRNFSITVNSAAIVSSENFTINTYTGNGSTQTIEGKIGTAASFNGSSSYIDTTFVPNNLTEISYSFWVYWDSSISGNVIGGTGNDGSTGNKSNRQTTSLSYSTNRFDYITKQGDFARHTTSLSDGWHHFVVTDNNASTASTAVNMYIDGSSVSFSEPASNNNYSTNTDMQIGRSRKNDGTIGNYFNGSIDQVRIFNKALSSSEVTTLYGESNTSTTKSTTDIFDDGSGVALYEFEKGAIDTGGTNGYIGSGGIFNGTSKIDITGFPNYGSTGVSISAWVNVDSFSNGPTIVNLYSNNSIVFGTDTSGNFFRSGQGTTVTSTSSLSTGTWHHVVMSAQSNGDVNLYLDGQPAGSGSCTTAMYSDNNVSDLIGAYGTLSQPMNGKIDQVRIFNKPISSSEVTTLYGETSASATKSTTDIFDDGSGVALYELDGNANDTGGTYNGTATNVSYAYDGTPTNVSFVGTSFQPDFVWIKARDNARHHRIFDSVRGENARGYYYQILSSTTDAQSTYDSTSWEGPYGGLTSLDSNGFTVKHGTSTVAYPYNGPEDYVAWCWKAGGAAVSNTDGSDTTSVSSNQDAGFSIVSLSKTDTNTRTYGHGLSSAPEMIILKRTASSDDWYVYHKDLGNTTRIFLNTSAAKVTGTGVWGSTTPTDSVFTLQAQNGGAHIAYCFHSVDSYQKVGSYQGNTSAVSVTTGFQPRFVLVKNSTTSGGNWTLWDDIRGGSVFLQPNNSGTEASGRTLTFNSDGFTINTDAGVNGNSNGDTFIYLAIA